MGLPQGLQSGTLSSHQDLSRQSTGVWGKRMLHLHIYLKLRKDVGFTNIFQWTDKCLLLKCQGEKSGQSESSTQQEIKMRALSYKAGFWLNVFIGCIISTTSTQTPSTTWTLKDVLQTYHQQGPAGAQGVCSVSCGRLGGKERRVRVHSWAPTLSTWNRHNRCANQAYSRQTRS